MCLFEHQAPRTMCASFPPPRSHHEEMDIHRVVLADPVNAVLSGGMCEGDVNAILSANQGGL